MFNHLKIQTLKHSRTGFSTLMALGTIGILLIIVTGLANTYIREMRLSRTSYDEVVASAGAEGIFEYAMLKVRNHREGFSDRVDYTEMDGKILVPITERSKNMKSSYSIIAASSDYSVDLLPNNHLVIPLFISSGTYISGLSRDPSYDITTQNTEGLTASFGDMAWTIVAMSGSENIGLTGIGDIGTTTMGSIRYKSSKCYSRNDGGEIPCDQAQLSAGDEELPYFYDDSVSVIDFVANTKNPYLMIFNNTFTNHVVQIKASKPFSLPTLSVRAEAQKNDSLQVFQFTEDKGKYYDALKYGVYNTEN